MGKTHKDSRQPMARKTIDISRASDATYDLFVNGRLDRPGLSEHWLVHELSVRWGCGVAECDEIVSDLASTGRASFQS